MNKIVGVGIGDFLIEAAAFELGIEYESMFKRYGAISNVFPAYAAAKMLELNLCEDWNYWDFLLLYMAYKVIYLILINDHSFRIISQKEWCSKKL